MVGWKAEYGYTRDKFTDTGANPIPELIKLNDGIFAFPSGVQLAVDSHNFGQVSTYNSFPTTHSSIGACAETFETLMGKEYYFAWLQPSQFDLKSPLIIQAIVSANKMSPEQYEISGTSPRPAFTYCHILSLQRYVFVAQSVPARTIITDEEFNVLYNSSSIFNLTVQNIGYFLIFNGEIKVGDFQDITNYLSVSILASTIACKSAVSDYSASGGGSSATSLKGLLTNLFSNYSSPDYLPTIDPFEPYPPSGPTPPDDPPGTFDDDSDVIEDSPLPTLSAANTGFTRIYNPTLSQVQDLARYLWTSDNIVETLWNKIKQFFDDPMQAIIGFNLVPVPVPDAGSEEFALLYIGTGVYLNVAASQFVDVDCGTLKIQRYYGSALDQSPNTKISCFLPFIGTVQLNCDEVMGTTLQVKYRVDIVSGSCVAKVFVDGSCLYQYSGHCAITIPFSSADFSNYVNAAIQVAKLVGTAVAGGAGALMAAGASEAEQETSYVVTQTTERTNTVRNPATGRQITAGTSREVVTTEYPSEDSSATKASFAGLTPANISNTVAQVISSKPVIEHSGSFSGNSGYLGVRRPFVIIERPNMCLPSDFQKLNGYPSMITLKLGDCHGYTRVQQIQLTGLKATNPEQAEILQLLKSGVAF